MIPFIASLQGYDLETGELVTPEALITADIGI
jgi:hypothetical protein